MMTKYIMVERNVTFVFLFSLGGGPKTTIRSTQW